MVGSHYRACAIPSNSDQATYAIIKVPCMIYNLFYALFQTYMLGLWIRWIYGFVSYCMVAMYSVHHDKIIIETDSYTKLY